MKIEDFTVSQLITHNSITTRHITLLNKNVSLCSTIVENELTANVSLKKYINLYYNNVYDSYICLDCLNKLPKDILDKIKFNYIVAKLKNED